MRVKRGKCKEKKNTRKAKHVREGHERICESKKCKTKGGNVRGKVEEESV